MLEKSLAIRFVERLLSETEQNGVSGGSCWTQSCQGAHRPFEGAPYTMCITGVIKTIGVDGEDAPDGNLFGADDD